MAGIPVSFASGLYDRLVPLATGEVRASGVSLNFIEIQHPRETFDRMAGHHEFDASEFSSSEYVTRHAAGDRSFIAIPAFPSRCFRHSFIFVNTHTVKRPEDLAGKTIGVPLYTMTAAVWIRGLLMHQYGVDLATINWIEGNVNKAGPYGQPSVLPSPKSVSLVPNRSSKSLNGLLADGVIDAIIGPDIPDCLNSTPHVRRLFPDYRKVEQDYYKQTGIFPIMHLVVVRRELWGRHKFITTSLFNALQDSKRLAMDRMKYLGTLRYMLPWLAQDLEEIKETFGDDCWPYGIDSNRTTLETLVQYLFEQGMIEKKMDIEELFAPMKESRVQNSKTQ
ncbi:uncharacterized protein PV07_09466 [Cladophialophora immunda]|uniref:SsuA/THI5-like domain-containing protein n=1 Tax=Cladophialophora immunda TaxID=569365 RepID=A0A0D1ZEZ7_9EURO|nr:uncharacterized protein PV07_09466 [Cladophialophora immunda]KIW26366.1 hypothetical protein PV07_09466 [Cladophialophora immunda]